MRCFGHLALILVLFSVFLASFPSNAKDHVFINKTLVDIQEPKSFLKDIDRETDVFPPPRFNPPFRFPKPETNRMNCDFRTKNCLWENVNKWSWVKPSYNQIKKDSPIYDFLDTSFALQVNLTDSKTSPRTITSPTFNVSGVFCFTFDYYFLVELASRSDLEVVLLEEHYDNHTIIWATSGVNVDSWAKGEAQIDYAGTYKIKIYAGGSTGFIALKNFKMSYGKCPTNICTFESGPCGYTSSGTGGNTFQVIPGEYTPGPIKFDHTSHSPYGHVMYANIEHTNDSAILLSPAMTNLQSQCLTFFFLKGGSAVRLRLLTYDISTQKTNPPLWQSNETHLVNEWIRVQEDLSISVPTNLVFEATKLDGFSSKIEIDDISLRPFKCPPPITCTFETDFCGWKEETKRTNNLLWSLGPGRVIDPSKLKKPVPFETTSALLYTDFTKMTGSMELVSEFVNVPQQGGACILLTYFVKSISLKTDLFQLIQIDITGNRKIIWNFNDTLEMTYFNQKIAYIPPTPHNVPYRLSLYAKSENAATYIGLRSFYYQTNDLNYCHHEAKSTTKQTTTTTTTLSPAKTLNCDFESGNTCNWKSGSHDIHFQVTSPAATAIKPLFFPFADTTEQSSNGKVVYAYSSSRYSAHIGLLYADNPYPNEKICFAFNYYFYSNGPSSFALTMDQNDQSGTAVREVPVFRGYGANEDVWRKAYVTIIPNDTYSTFSFRASLRNGIFVLDDIYVRQGLCYSYTHDDDDKICDFEQNQTCIFEPIFNGYHSWKVYNSSVFRINDHTTHSKDGHYYGLDFSVYDGKSKVKKKSQVLSRQMSGKKYRCVQFSYLLADVYPNTTLSYDIITGTDQMTKHWEIAGSTLNLWFTHKVPTPETIFDLRMSIETFGEPDGKVFVDDIKFLRSSCNNPHNCDFENGDICSMQAVLQTNNQIPAATSSFFASSPNGTAMAVHYLTDCADQIWHVFTPRQSGDYLQHDNTYRNMFGRYLLLTGDDKSDRGIIITERYNLAENGGKICLSLAVYKANAQSVLEIYQGESFNETHAIKIWDFQRQTGDWETFEILAYPFNQSTLDIFFYIVGTLNDKLTYIGLDDIRLKASCSNPSNNLPTTKLSPRMTSPTPDPNNPDFFTCSNGTKISSSLTCNYIKNCIDGSDESSTVCGSCDFSHDNWCRYTRRNTFGDLGFNFRDRVSVGPSGGSDDNANFVIASGHTGASYLSSPIIHQAYIGCAFSFSYYYSSNEPLNNDSLTSMKVYIQMTDIGRSVLIWESAFERIFNASWKSVSIPIRRVTHPFRLAFYAYQSVKTETKVHAIDEVRLRECSPPTVHSSSCDSYKFTCSNRVCISKSYRCDFEDDCGDGSDEQNCPVNYMTSFESGIGLWGKGIFKNWQRLRASHMLSLRDGPTYDHTTDYQRTGWFLFANAQSTSSAQNVSVVAEIDSPPFSASSSSCYMNFYMYKNSKDSSLLVVLQNIYTGKRVELREIGSSAYKWTQYSISVPPYLQISSTLYRVILTATLNASQSAFAQPYIAIDDISFTPGCIIHTGPVVMPTLPNHSTMTTPEPDNCPTISCLSPKGTKVCLKSTQFCDFRQDCKDGSDELNCGDCNFESTMCGWKNYLTKNTWKVIKPASSSPGPLPKTDADGNSTGGYLSVIKSLSGTDLMSILQSPTINSRSASTCKLTFSYFSNMGGFLAVRQYRFGSYLELFSTRNPATHWTSFKVDVGAMYFGFNLEFYGGTNYRFGLNEDIAIDNIKMVNCNPYIVPPTAPPAAGSLNCTFEADLCGWSVTGLQGQRSNWLRTSNFFKEPGNDHTSLQYPLPAHYGTWMSTQSRPGSLVPDMDFLVSTTKLKSGQTYCFSFWLYFMTIDQGSYFALYASKTGKASSTPKNNLDYTPLWRTSQPLSQNWNQFYVEISPQGADFYLLFIAAIDSSGIIGLDDTLLINGKCPIVSNTFCNFEVNFCDWKLLQGSLTRSSGSSKIPDHTTGTTSGHFIEDTGAGSTTGEGRKAIITKELSTLPIFNNSNSNLLPQPFCLQFYYYFSTMFVNANMDDSNSKFTVKVKLSRGMNSITQNITILDTFNDGLLNAWALFQYSFKGFKTGNIEIDGLKSQPFTRMLLDDISIEQRTCQTSGSCDFEFSNCGWENVQKVNSNSKKVLWLRIQPNSKYIKGLILPYDHTTTTKNGHYLVMPTQMKASSYSILRSPQMHRKSYPVVCFSMYYFAKGVNVSIVALQLRLMDLGKMKSQVRTMNTTTSFYWRKVEFEFTNLPNFYVFQIEGFNKDGMTSNIGLDDIKITQSHCSTQDLPTTTTPVPPSEKRLDCTFDNGQCNWKFDHYAWKMGKFSDMQNNYAPPRDHTSQTSSGHYLMFQSSAPVQYEYNVQSTQNISYDKDHCLTAWYYEDGEGNPFNLGVYMVLSQYNVVANDFSTAIENRRRWNLFKADIQYDSAYKTNTIGLQIRYSPTTNRQKRMFSIFALDDIKVRPGKCNHLHDYVYTMASGIEDLELEYIQPLTNSIGQLYTPSFDSLAGAPTVDHTTETNKGTYFLFMNRHTRAPTVYKVTLSMTDIPADKSSFFPGAGYTCIRFAYQISGNATLKVFVAPNNAFTSFYQQMTPVWQSKYSKNVWTIGEINKQAHYEHKVVFYMEKTPDKTSFVALDDLSLLSHQCQAPIDCDFENGRICSYSPLVDKTTSQFNWGLFTSPPQDRNWPGPTYDHTTKNYGGGYLFLSAFRSVGNFNTPIVSKVVSGPRNVDPSKSYCLSLWMRMTTADLKLKLSILRYGPLLSDANRTQTIASKANIAETDWTRIAVPIDQTMLINTHEIQLVIEGTLATNSKGLIAIDDILLVEGSCGQGNLVCENGTPITQAQICNFVKDCPSGLDELNCGTTKVCNFEGGDLCGWGNMTTYPQKWLLTSARDQSNNKIAPAFDGDANKTGHYLMVSLTSSSSSSTAEMALNFPSPLMYLKNSYQSCVMQFDYYISTSNPKTYNYNLDVRVGRDRSDWSTVYSIARAWSLNGWSKAYAHIGERANQFMVDVVGHLDLSSSSFMAVDNIQFINCSMPKPLGPNATCSSGQFMCKKYRFCVSNDAICNYKNDCGDESDELDCFKWTRCNFEYTFATCHIKTDDMEHQHSFLNVNVEWNIERGQYSDMYDPKIDNTLRTGSGRYIALGTVNYGPNLKQTFTSEFYSPMMISTNGNACRMRFFYFINGEPVTISQTYLNIYIRYANKRTVEPTSILLVKLNIQGDLQQRWNFATVQFTSTIPFQFVFRGRLGTNSSRLAIDDISFDPSGCLASVVPPLGPPTTLQPVTTQTGQTETGKPVTVTPSPGIRHQEKPKSSNGGKIAAAILVPFFVILGAIGAFFAYQKYQKRVSQGDEHIALSMKNIQEKTDY